MIYTGLLSLLLAEYAANQKCSAVLLCSADSIYPILEMFSIQQVGTRCYLAVLWSEIVLMLLSVVTENRRNVSTAR